jgi:hypothetical protein
VKGQTGSNGHARVRPRAPLASWMQGSLVLSSIEPVTFLAECFWLASSAALVIRFASSHRLWPYGG